MAEVKFLTSKAQNMRNEKNPIDYESIKQQAFEQFRSDKSLTGKGAAFAPLFKQFLEAALQAGLKNIYHQKKLTQHRIVRTAK